MINQNKKFILIILTSFLLSLIYFYSNLYKENPKAYITNQGDNTVSVVDLVTLEVIKTYSFQSSNMGVGTVGVKVGDELWMGSFKSNRLAYINL